jgi:hypothetical protein
MKTILFLREELEDCLTLDYEARALILANRLLGKGKCQASVSSHYLHSRFFRPQEQLSANLSALIEIHPPRVERTGFKRTHPERGQKLQIWRGWVGGFAGSPGISSSAATPFAITFGLWRRRQDWWKLLRAFKPTH